MKTESYLLIVQVHQEKHAEDVVVALTEVGVKDVYSLTGVNEFRRLPHNLALFAGFKGELGKSSSLSKIFFAVVDDAEVPELLMNALKHADIDFIQDDLGSITLLPVHSFHHFSKA